MHLSEGVLDVRPGGAVRYRSVKPCGLARRNCAESFSGLLWGGLACVCFGKYLFPVSR